MNSVLEQAQKILEYIPKIPVTDSSGSFEIVAHEGEVQSFGIINSDDLAIDRLELDKATETLRTKIQRAILFDAYKGACDLHYIMQGQNHKQPLNRFKQHRLPPGIPFVLKTNGTKCSVLLRMEELNG